MQSILQILGNNIRKLRKDLGWTQEKLAEKAGISVPFMTQIELGRKSASLEVVAQIATALGVNYDTLFCNNIEEKKINSISHSIQIFENNLMSDIQNTLSNHIEKLEKGLKSKN